MHSDSKISDGFTMIGFVIFSSLAAILVYGVIKHIMWRLMDTLPGPPTKWLTHLYVVGPDKVEAMIGLDHKYKGFYRLYFAPWQRAVMVSDPKCAKEVLKTSCPKLEPTYFAVRPWLGDGLLLAKGKKWSRSRRLLTPAFHFDILKPYMDIYNDAATTLVDDVWTKRAASGESFDIVPEVSRMTLDVILRCAMSTESDCQKQVGKNPYVDAVTDISELAMYRLTMPHHRLDFIYRMSSNGKKFFKALKILHDKSEEVIRTRRMSLEEDGLEHVAKERCRDFLDLLLTAKDEFGVGLTDQEIRDEVDTFLFEGHDTTAHGILWTLYCLGLNPEHQTRCREEIDSVLGDVDRDLTWNDMDKLEYTHMCIRESMRIYPPVPMIGRTMAQDVNIHGHHLPKGTDYIICIMGMHRNPDLFDNPMEFRPSRFSTEEMKKRDSFSYVPFSAGPRNCIGQVFASHEEKITIAKILRKFVVETDADHPIKLFYGLVLRSQTGVRLRLKERQHHQ